MAESEDEERARLMAEAARLTEKAERLRAEIARVQAQTEEMERECERIQAATDKLNLITRLTNDMVGRRDLPSC